MTTLQSRLDPEKVAALLNQDGPFSMMLKGYESREEQKKMLLDILQAYNEDQIALIEAGTGTGKSVAYLIPAILWAVQQKERTVISTHTITLQEQLLSKDIPLVTKALGASIKAVLVKGISNYLCLRKLEEAVSERMLMTSDEATELDRIEQWSQSTRDGSRSSLPMVPSPQMWEKVCAESDTCSAKRCHHYQDCHFFKARNNAQDANILVVNHHLLFADLASDNNILPEFARIVIDEAHHIEDVATEFFASKTSQLNMLRIVGRLAAEKGGKTQGKLALLKMKIMEYYRSREEPEEIHQIISLLNIDLPALRHDLLKEIVDTFESFQGFMGHLSSSEDEHRLRIRQEHLTHPFWPGEVLPNIDRLIQITSRYNATLESIEKQFKQLDDPALNENTHGARQEISAMRARLDDNCLTLKKFASTVLSNENVRWIESQKLRAMVNTHVVDAELNVSKALAEKLFEPYSSIILCSATLTTNRNFAFIRNRFGLTEELLPKKTIKESIYDSPFDYQKQTLFAIPSDLPSPDDPNYVELASLCILDAIEASKGNAFILFTSYYLMQQCYNKLADKLKQQRYPVLKQGETNRQQLLEQFKRVDRSVLFATDSFWEGVDVVGEALRCVIIVKLPFKVPSEPIIEARTEYIAKSGKDPFTEYSLPMAIVKFKQGYGRLIRSKQDRGCIVCLDSRILSRGYGKLFRNSLPSSGQWVGPRDQLLDEMKKFYYRTRK
jgi:ATP-dependent DNA helicase DinG